MIARFTVPWLLMLIAICSLACRESEDQTPTEVQIAPRDDENTRRRSILDAAREYRDFEFVYTTPNWSPLDCRRPEKSGTFSASAESTTHGQKLYFLFVRESMAYWMASRLATQPIGQTLVKETWLPVEVDPDDPLVAIHSGESVESNVGNPHDDNPLIPVQRDGKSYQPGSKGPLFIMHYLGKYAHDIDNGWIYATLTPDALSITAIGRIESCMKCHNDAPHDRLFGMKNSDP